jgi:hypothetical protein
LGKHKHPVHDVALRRARRYVKHNAVRVRNAALDAEDLAQDACVHIALYLPRMFSEPNVVDVSLLSYRAFCNALRKHERSSAAMVATRNDLPEWVTRKTHNGKDNNDRMQRAAALLNAPNCPPHVQRVLRALMNATTYTSWCMLTYGKPMPLTLKRLREFSLCTRKEFGIVLAWLRAAQDHLEVTKDVDSG